MYEALLATKYLRSLGVVDGDRVGVLGHSGGSSVARLAVRISPWLRSVVVDHATDFRDRCAPLRVVHCETVPSLFPIGSDVMDLSSLAIPHRKVRYGYRERELREEILAFFDATLRGGEPTAPPGAPRLR